MPVDQISTVDVIGIDQTGDVILTISDHLEWDSKKEHIFILQEKVNRYLAFIESGEIHQSYPDAEGRKKIISIVALHSPDEDANRFLSVAKEIVEGSGIGFRFQQKHFNSPP